MPFTHLALSIAAAVTQQSDSADLEKTVRRSIAAQGPIVTDADNAAIAAKCGLNPAAPPRNIRFEDGALHCPDGRVVKDAETRAMSDRIGARASAHVAKVMSDPEVNAAIERYTDEKAREALRSAPN